MCGAWTQWRGLGVHSHSEGRGLSCDPSTGSPSHGGLGEGSDAEESMRWSWEERSSKAQPSQGVCVHREGVSSSVPAAGLKQRWQQKQQQAVQGVTCGVWTAAGMVVATQSTRRQEKRRGGKKEKMREGAEEERGKRGKQRKTEGG
ncbi:unnamed protein product [Closterium sp. NIES-64]|nr:unnamed protein product [Closterium sp. NIES-64]